MLGEHYSIVGDVITLYPSLLGAGASGTGTTTFPDGVYKIIITAICPAEIAIYDVGTSAHRFFDLYPVSLIFFVVLFLL